MRRACASNRLWRGKRSAGEGARGRSEVLIWVEAEISRWIQAYVYMMTTGFRLQQFTLGVVHCSESPQHRHHHRHVMSRRIGRGVHHCPPSLLSRGIIMRIFCFDLTCDMCAPHTCLLCMSLLNTELGPRNRLYFSIYFTDNLSLNVLPSYQNTVPFDQGRPPKSKLHTMVPNPAKSLFPRTKQMHDGFPFAPPPITRALAPPFFSLRAARREPPPQRDSKLLPPHDSTASAPGSALRLARPQAPAGRRWR